MTNIVTEPNNSEHSENADLLRDESGPDAESGSTLRIRMAFKI